MRIRQRLRARSGRGQRFSGRSSESNPSTKRFREAARAAARCSRAVSVDDEEHSAGDIILQQIPLHEMQIDDAQETCARSEISERSCAESQLSKFTSCSNATFDTVHRVWRSGSLLQKEVLAVLAATTELIKEKDGRESDAEYFVTLLTVIEGTAAEDEWRLAAAAYLLGLVARKNEVKDVVRKCFSRAHQILEKKLDETRSGIALSKLIDTFGTILHQQTSSIWRSSKTRLSLVKIGMFVLHDKPRVRSSVRRVLNILLNDPLMSVSNGCHPGADVVGEFLIKEMEQYAKYQYVDSLCYLLNLAEHIMHIMPPNVFKNFADSALALLSFPDLKLRCTTFRCFKKIFLQLPSDTTFSSNTNVHLIYALRDSAPAVLDPSVTCIWMEALCESHVCLALKDSKQSVAALSSSLKPIFHTFELGNDSIAAVTHKVITRLVEHCVQLNGELASECLNLCDEALNPRTAAVWRYVLRTESKIFEVCQNAISHESFQRALKTLAGLHHDAYEPAIPDIDLTVGAAVRYVGAENVLRALPLDLDPQNPALVLHFERSWLLPILRSNIHNQPLSLALQYFLPLAHQLRKKAPNDDNAQKIFICISNQLWDLLPSVLNSASDFVQTFPQLAKILGITLKEQKDLRLVILSSLRSALRYALQPDAPEERKNVMRFFAYSFLREFFCLYTVSNSSLKSVEGLSGNSIKTLRCSLLETIRMYVDLTPHNVINNFVNLAVEKTKVEEISLDQKTRILDLMATLVKQASELGLDKIFSVIRPWFRSTESALQKKSFRILEEIAKRMNNSNVSGFFATYSDVINGILDQNLDNVSMSARAALIAIYYYKLLSLTSYEDTEYFTKSFLPNIILCLDKSHNIRTRSNALNCFVQLCQQLILFGAQESRTPSFVLHSVLEIIFMLLASEKEQKTEQKSLEIARSTTIALNVIAQKFLRILDASLLSRLLAHGCSWIGDGRPAVRVLVIRLLRILAKKLPAYTMQQYQELILSAVFDGQLTTDVTQKVRKANRLLLEVLVDRYGVEILMNRTDKLDWIKQLKAISKIRNRKKRRDEAKKLGNRSRNVTRKQEYDMESMTRTARTAGADTVLELLDDVESGDDMEMEMDRESIGGKTRGSSLWLKDDDDEDVMDLLDRNMMLKKIATTRPNLAKDEKFMKQGYKGHESSTGGFKLAKDGRLIIKDLDKNERKRKHASEVYDSEGKKLRGDSDLESNVDSTDGIDDNEIKSSISNKSGWKPGGKGIHRNVKKDRNATAPFLKKKKICGDARKKGEKYEPYAYLPISKCKGQKTELRKLIKGAKKGAVHGSKVRKMHR